MANRQPKILLQTTIRYTSDDWNSTRFTLLADELRTSAEVVSRDREPGPGGNDPVLIGLPESDLDQLWLFAVDAGDGLTDAECRAITAFRARGGGVFVTRDHMDLGASVCNVGDIGKAHFFHSKQVDPRPELRVADDTITTAISWPNFHSGSNGDVQQIEAVDPVHEVLRTENGVIATLPAHPHEGGVGTPADVPGARLVSRGHSSLTGRRFDIAVAFESNDRFPGRGWAESTFHHFCDYNWDISRGCPSFVSEPPSTAIADDPHVLDDTKRYVRNLATWLGTRA